MKLLDINLNGQKAGRSLIKSMITGLNDKNIRTEKGGYLFKAAADEKTLFLGILPEFNQGERNYHYNIELPGSPEYFLTGSLNPEGIFSILFIPVEKELSSASVESYKYIYKILAENLLERGITPPGELNMVTTMILESSGLFPEGPVSLVQITNPPKHS
jgi:hypothetical protein